jgi:hypothetical protein
MAITPRKKRPNLCNGLQIRKGVRRVRGSMVTRYTLLQSHLRFNKSSCRESLYQYTTCPAHKIVTKVRCQDPGSHSTRLLTVESTLAQSLQARNRDLEWEHLALTTRASRTSRV